MRRFPSFVFKIAFDFPDTKQMPLHARVARFGLLIGVIAPLSAPSVARAEPPECLIVRGTSQTADPEGAFSKYRSLSLGENVKVAGRNCRSFPDWASLQEAASKSRRPLFIFQIAHGDEKGNFYCDGDIENNKKTLDRLEQLAETHRVFSPIFSCFSADLMAEKLKRDRKRRLDSPALKNLCIASSSAFNAMSSPVGGNFADNLSEIKPGMSAEEWFKRHTKSGFITSAEWTGARIDEYLEKARLRADAETAAEMLERMNSNANYCPIQSYSQNWRRVRENRYYGLTYADYVNLYRLMSDFRGLKPVLKADLRSLNASPPLVDAKASLEGGKPSLSYLEFLRIARRDLSTEELKPVSEEWYRFTRDLRERFGPDSIFRLASAVHSPKDSKELASIAMDKDDGVPDEILLARLFEDSLKDADGFNIDTFYAFDSPHSLMRGFVLGSLDKPVYKDPLDQKRREACRDFRF